MVISNLLEPYWAIFSRMSNLLVERVTGCLVAFSILLVFLVGDVTIPSINAQSGNAGKKPTKANIGGGSVAGFINSGKNTNGPIVSPNLGYAPHRYARPIPYLPITGTTPSSKKSPFLRGYPNTPYPGFEPMTNSFNTRVGLFPNNRIRIRGVTAGGRTTRMALRLRIPVTPVARPGASMNWIAMLGKHARNQPWKRTSGHYYKKTAPYPVYNPMLVTAQARKAFRSTNGAVTQTRINNRYGYGIAGGGARTNMDPKVLNAVELALNWLAQKQLSNGAWDGTYAGGGGRSDVAATSLALLSYFYYGENPSVAGKYQNILRRGISWLLSQNNANPPTTEGPGDFRDGGNGYEQSVAVQALIETHHLMPDDTNILTAAQQGLDFLINNLQHQGGGWRYNTPPTGAPGDLSVSGWSIRTLGIAKEFGVSNPNLSASMTNAAAWLDSLRDPADPSVFGYKSAGDGSHGRPNTFSALGLSSHLFLGKKPDDPLMEATWGNLEKDLENTNFVNNVDYYYWYNGAYASAKKGRDAMGAWMGKLTPILLSKQVQTNLNGSLGVGVPCGYWPALPEAHYYNIYMDMYTTEFALLSLVIQNRFGKPRIYVPTNLRR